MESWRQRVMAFLPDMLHGRVKTLLAPGFWGVAVGLTVASLVLTVVGIPWLICRLPADYFQGADQAWFHRTGEAWPALRVLFHFGKNLIGITLVLAGLAMLVLPGQGLLTVLAGLLLADFPGKRALERRIISRPGILRQVNAIRKRAGQPPLFLP